MTQHDDNSPSGAAVAGSVEIRAGREPRLGISATVGADAPGPRILIVAPQPFYQDRGTPIAMRQVLLALSELGRRVDLLTYPIGSDVALPGLRIFRCRNPLNFETVPIGFSLRKVILDLQITAALRRRVARERYACIHAVEEAAFPAAVLARRRGIPLLYDMQSSLPEQLAEHAPFRWAPSQRALEAAERWLLRRANVVVTSAGLAPRVRAATPHVAVREWHFPSAPAGADPGAVEGLRHRLAIPRGVPVVLYSGTFETYQGLPNLLGAIPLVLAHDPRTIFVFVGADGTGDADGVLASASRLIASGSLRIVGRQPRDAMPAFLALADVLVSPRAYGGNLPLKIFDYLAANRPIVATDIPTHRSVLSEERAVLVEPRSESLAAGIVAVLADPARAERLAASARQYAKANLGWARFVQSVEALYREVERHAGAVRR